MNCHNLKSTCFIWYTNINFSIKSTKTSKSWVNTVWSIGGTNTNDLTSSFDTIHQCKKLSNNSSFDFTISFFSVWSNRVNLIDKDDRWLICICFFECFSKIFFCLTSHFGHDFWTIQQEEESTCLVSNSSSNKSLT